MIAMQTFDVVVTDPCKTSVLDAFVLENQTLSVKQEAASM